MKSGLSQKICYVRGAAGRLSSFSKRYRQRVLSFPLFPHTNMIEKRMDLNIRAKKNFRAGAGIVMDSLCPLCLYRFAKIDEAK